MPSPPFRADHVGSLLRPDNVHKARVTYRADVLGPHGFSTCSELKAIENEAIKKMVAIQECAGLPAVTDGEMRRSFWHYDFMGALTGLELVERDTGVQFHGMNLRPIFPTITGRHDFPDNHPKLNHFDDLAKTYNKAVHAFYEAGCRYLQMDDIFFAYLCDPKHRAEKKSQGMDPDWLISKYAKTMHDAISDRPEDMIIAMHLCRGNFQSTWAAEGAYDPAADAVFNQTGIDVYFMEYDSDRAGGLEPLRLLPRGKKRVLPGFITTKTPELESVDDLIRRFDEASKYADIDQLGIAPQCGFASTEEGNRLTQDDQKRKLELVVKTAEVIWGGVT